MEADGTTLSAKDLAAAASSLSDDVERFLSEAVGTDERAETSADTRDDGVYVDVPPSADIDEPTADASASDIAAVAYALEADVERFLSEATIAETTVNEEHVTLEDVIEDRRMREEQRERVRQRAEDLFAEALTNEQHASDVRDLTDVIGKLSAPAEAGASAAGGEGGAGATEDKENDDALAGSEAANVDALRRRLDAIVFSGKSYPTFGMATGDAPGAPGGAEGDEEAARALREETRRLRACLARGKHSDAFRNFVEEVQPARTGAVDAAAEASATDAAATRQSAE